MPTANESLLDAAISHQIGIMRFSTATVRKAIALLNRVDSRLVAEINRIDPSEGPGSWSQMRLEKLLDAVRVILKEAYNGITGTIDDDVRALGAYEAVYQGDLFKKVIPVAVDIVTPAPAQIYAAIHARPFQGMILKEWYSGLEEGTQRRLRDAIRMGYVEGRTTDQIVRDLLGTRSQNYADGVLEGSRRGVEMVARTALNHTANVARNQVYRENSSVIKGVRWVATLDSRTSAVCRGRDGTVYPVDSGPRPPGHPNCRSSTAPVLKSWKEMGISLKEAPEGTRASMDGQVPASETYDSWLRKQSKDFQEDILGVTKGKLFRDGGLTLDRFVDAKGKEYSLLDLKRRDAAAFERAGV